MADLVNRAQMRKELPRLSGQAFIQSQEVLTSSFRRIGAGDYRLAIDDVALLAAINSFAAQEKAEDDETQTKLDTINASLGTINTSITTLNANLTTLLNEVKTALGGIDASIDETTAAVNDVNEDTEAISTKVDTANTNITSVKTSVDAVGAKVDTVNTSVGTVATNVQAVGTTVSSIDTKLDTANTKLDTIASNTAPATPGGDEPEQDFPKITLFNGGQSFSPDGSNTFTVNMLDNPNSNRYRIKQDGSFLSGSATADGAVLQVAGSENDDLKTLQTGSGTFSITHGGQTKQFNVNVTGNTDSSPKVVLVTGDTSSRSESFDLSDSPTVNISNGEVYTGSVYVRNATASQFSGSVSSSIASGTLLTDFRFDRDTVTVNSGNYGVLTFTATAKDPASSSDSAVVNVSIGDNDYTINFAFSE